MQMLASKLQNGQSCGEDKRDGVQGTSMKASQADQFEQSAQMKTWASWAD